MSLASVLKKLLQVTKTAIKGIRFETRPATEHREEEEELIISVSPHGRERHRCPVCGKRCKVHQPAYRPSPRRWRTLDLGCIRTYLEFAPDRISCPEHGNIVERVPWARHGSWSTRPFEDQVAWLCVHSNQTTVSELMRIDWHTTGSIIGRVEKDLGLFETSRFDGLSMIGIDETSYTKGHNYLTVVIDHVKGRLIWCAKGYGKDVLDSFFDLLSEGQRASIEVVTRDGARWIESAVRERCPAAEQVTDPFHAVAWVTDALDEMRKRAWREAKAEARQAKRDAPKRKRGRPGKGEVRPEKVAAGKASEVKGSRFALLKNPEDLTARQAETLESIARKNPHLYRGYLLKEGFRDVFKAGTGEEAAARIGRWLSWACRSRIPEMVEMSRKVRRHRESLVRAVDLGVSNARVEAINNKIGLCIKMGSGFANIDNLIALVMLRCGGAVIELPGRPRVAKTPHKPKKGTKARTKLDRLEEGAAA